MSRQYDIFIPKNNAVKLTSDPSAYEPKPARFYKTKQALLLTAAIICFAGSFLCFAYAMGAII